MTDHILDIEDHHALLAYLRAGGRIGPDEQPAISTLAGGVSNRTVLVRRTSTEAWVLKQALAKLRVPVDWYSSPTRIHREALGLRWLERLAPPGTITSFIFEDHEYHVLAMQAVPYPHENWKTLLLRGQVESDHIEQFGRLLAAIHLQAYRSRAQIAPVFEDRSFFESLRLEPYYSYTAQQLPAAMPFLRHLIEETRTNRLTVVHGDYSPKNILVHAGRLVLLDHEVIHFGDPAFDLGFSLTHLLSKAHHLPGQRQELARAATLYWQTYAHAAVLAPWLPDLETRVVRHTLACLLARVAGRSPLEYLDPMERGRQQAAVLDLMVSPPAQVLELIVEFVARMDNHAHH